MNKTTEALLARIEKLEAANKLAEEALVSAPIEYDFHGNPMDEDYGKLSNKALAAIREALAEPDIEEMTLTQIASRHEPVNPTVTERQFKLAMKQWEDWKEYALELQARLVKYEGGSSMVLNAAPVPPVKQEPVAFMFKVKRTTKAITVLDEFASVDYFPQDDEEIVSKEPLIHAAPVSAKREWVELTDYEIVMLYAESPMCDSEMIDFAREVITAFKEKNK